MWQMGPCAGLVRCVSSSSLLLCRSRRRHTSSITSNRHTPVARLSPLLPMQVFVENMSKGVCYHLLQCCICLETGETTYHLITHQGFDSDSFLGTHCIRMFSHFGRLKEANHIFAGIARPSLYAWSAIIFTNAMLGQSLKALYLYGNMNQVVARPDSHTFVAVLRACTNEQELTVGMLVHAHVVECGLESVDYIGSGIIGLYAHCNRLHDAQLVFDRQVKPNVVLWSALIHGYSENECFLEAISLFGQMQNTGVEANEVTHVCVIKACASLRATTQGMWMHFFVTEAGDELQSFVGSSLLDMYGRFGMLYDACRIFDKLRKQDVVEWNAMIAGESQHGCVQEVVQLLNQMQQHGIDSNQLTLSSILKVCANTKALNLGKQVHAHICGRGLKFNLFLINAIVDLYASCGDIQNACKVLKMSEERNVATWAIIIAGCAKHGHDEAAFLFFEELNEQGTMLNSATFLSILSACSHIEDLKLMHAWIIEAGFELDAAVASLLISRYGECTSVLESLTVFEYLHEHDIVLWNALINAYAQHGHLQKAFSLFDRMQVERARPDDITYGTLISACAREGLVSETLHLFQQMQLQDIKPNAKVFSRVLEVCSKLETPKVGKVIHALIVESDMEGDMHVVESLVHMHLLGGSMEDAEHIFERIQHPNVGVWNAMLLGYMQIGQIVDESSFIHQEATIQEGHLVKIFQLYSAMNEKGIKPDQATFAYILKLCSMLTELDHGNQIYADIVEAGVDQDLLIGNMLIGMYTAFNSYEDALHVFIKRSKRNVVTFNTFFAACAQQGSFYPVLNGFNMMQQQGVKADDITFLSLLSACCHAGKEEGALFYFKTMRECYGIEPTCTHYTCMVDLVGRTGYLKEGQDLLHTMPFRPSTIAYTSILSHCTLHSSLNGVEKGINGLSEGKQGYRGLYLT